MMARIVLLMDLEYEPENDGGALYAHWRCLLCWASLPAPDGPIAIAQTDFPHMPNCLRYIANDVLNSAASLLDGKA